MSSVTQQRSGADHAVAFDMNLKVPMRDGVLLSADVYRPAGVARAPAILYRTPYDNNGPQPTQLGVKTSNEVSIHLEFNARESALVAAAPGGR